jgi:hypothetical protein
MDGVIQNENKLTGTLSGKGTLMGATGTIIGRDGKSAYEVAVKNGFDGTEEEWLESLKGEQGIQGERGETGATGKDGKSPNVSLVEHSIMDGGGVTIKVTNPNGTLSSARVYNGNDGVSPVVQVSKVDKMTTISITDATGTKNAYIFDGKDGESGGGTGGEAGEDGIGIESIVQTVKSTADKGVNVMTITLTDGSAYDFEVQNGSKGSKGATGNAGTSVTVTSVSESTADGGNNVVTFSDGKTLTVKNGTTGKDGADGQPGVYVGSGTPPVGTKVHVDPSGEAYEPSGGTGAPPVVLADMTTTEQANTLVVPLNDDVRNYGRLLITLTMKHYGTAASPSIMFFDTVTEDSYGMLTSIKGLFDETSATTVYLDVEFFANSILVRAAKKVSVLSASEGVYSYVVSIANHFITADLVDAIRFSGAYMDTGAKIKVEGVPR